jgi:hypothetical protein
MFRLVEWNADGGVVYRASRGGRLTGNLSQAGAKRKVGDFEQEVTE